MVLFLLRWFPPGMWLGIHRRHTTDFVAAYLAAKKAKGLSRASLASYKSWLNQFADAYQDLPTKPEQIESFIVRWEGVTRCNAYRSVHALYSWLVRTRRIGLKENPFPFVEPPKRPKRLPRMFTDAEWIRIMAAAKPGPERRLVLALMDGAPRIGELVGRSQADLTPAGIKLDGKRGERMIPLLPETIAYFREDSGWWLFPKKDKHGRYLDEPASVNTLKNHFAAIVRRAGITGMKRGPHTVRHTSSVKWLHSSGDIYALRDLLGHASVKETEVYAAMLTAHLLSDKHRQHSALRQFAQPEEASVQTP